MSNRFIVALALLGVVAAVSARQPQRPRIAGVAHAAFFVHDIEKRTGTRTELMEPATIDGVPAPSSQAPPPRR